MRERNKISTDKRFSNGLDKWISVCFLVLLAFYILSLCWPAIPQDLVMRTSTLAAFLAAIFAFLQYLAAKEQVSLMMKKPDFGDKIEVYTYSRDLFETNPPLSLEEVKLEFLLENHADTVAKYPAMQLRFTMQDVKRILIKNGEKTFLIEEGKTWLFEAHLDRTYPHFRSGLPLDIHVYEQVKSTKVDVIVVAENSEPVYFSGEVMLEPGKRSELKKINKEDKVIS